MTSQKLIMVLVILVALLGAYFVANVVLKPMFSGGGEATAEKPKDDHGEEKKDSHGDGHGDGHGEHGEAAAESSDFFKIEGIIVNPAATGGSRFLTTTIGFEFEDNSSIGTFKSKEIKIRDALIQILSSKTISELADAQSREMIRRQILKTINQICQPAQAEAVYFVDYVLQ